MPDPTAVRSMFARIGGRYDLLNRSLSLGIDRRWRKQTVARAGKDLRRKVVVDVCTGTGDLAVAFARAGARVVAVDFTPQMLRRAPRKLRPSDEAALFVCGDAQRLPLRERCADVATIAFGLRNLADRARGLAELVRTVRPGGRVLVLEFAPPPRGPLGFAYRTYFTRILPAVGGLVSGDREAYRYLPRTVLEWPTPEALEVELEAAGLVDPGHRLLTGGVACLHWGAVPEAGG